MLGTIAAEWLFNRCPRAPEGELTQTKAHLVQARALAERARQLELGPLLRLGRGEDRSGGREKQSLLACALEAVIGAVFVDGGMEAARSTVAPWLEAGAAEAIGAGDAKSDLQEVLQAQGLEPPVYRHVGREGPDHDPAFHVECWIEGRFAASASGRSKKAAERSAARRVLRDAEPTDRPAPPSRRGGRRAADGTEGTLLDGR